MGNGISEIVAPFSKAGGKSLLSSSYGFRWGKFHRGADFKVAGDITRAVKDNGVVIALKTNGKQGGDLDPAKLNEANYVIAEYPDGSKSYHWHLALNEVWVKKGQRLRIGEALGLVGNTGYTTGAHLHFEYHIYGQPVDPILYINFDRKVATVYKDINLKELYLRLKEDRPDVFSVYPATESGAFKWWKDHGREELILKLGTLGRSDVYKAVQEKKVSLEAWYIKHAKLEYENIWKSKAAATQDTVLKKELEAVKKELEATHQVAGRVAEENVALMRVQEEMVATQEKALAIMQQHVDVAHSDAIVSRSRLTEQVPEVIQLLITNPEATQGLKQWYHALIDKNISSMFWRAFFKYNIFWIGFMTFSTVSILALYVQGIVTNPGALGILTSSSAFISSALHFFLTHADTNKDGTVDFKDLVGEDGNALFTDLSDGPLSVNLSESVNEIEEQ